jgi:uncharacterized protein YjbI with pentapeptide repeats
MTIFDIFGNAIYESSAATMAETLKEAARAGVSLRKANLYKAYLRWEDFRGADMREVNLTMAIIRDTDFRDTDLRNSIMRWASCRFADFSGADLRDTDFRRADLYATDFSAALITGAKFDLDGVPVVPDIHQRVYEVANQPREQDDWYAYEAPHFWCQCVVTAAEEKGQQLVGRLGTLAAAALIYIASDPKLERIPNFYVPERDAFKEMERLANQ